MDSEGCAGMRGLFCAAAKPLPTKKAVAVNLKRFHIRYAKDKTK